jgi:hypothetical protein
LICSLLLSNLAYQLSFTATALLGGSAELLAAKTALSPADRADVASLIASYGDDLSGLIPAVLPVKEHVALLATCLLRFATVADTILAAYTKTATDVLRLAVALSDGDASSLQTPSFAPLRAERRLLLGLLEACANSTDCSLR